MILIIIAIVLIFLGIIQLRWVEKYRTKDLLFRPISLMTQNGIGFHLFLGLAMLIAGLVTIVIGIIIN